MFGFGKHGPDGRYGAILDIGSGSVGVAIVASDPTDEHPEIIWTHRERMIIRDIDSIEESAKHITTALLNAVLTLGAEGIQSLQTHEKGAEISAMQVAVSAPWSYTIVKTIAYKKENTFEVTRELVRELVETARKQTLEMLDEDDIIRKLGLQVITRATINILANNYRTSEHIYGQDANEVSISHVSAISTEHLMGAVVDAHDKVLPNSKTEYFSFMLLFYCVVKQLAADITEICLVDITHEATEVGIVRDGVLQYVTHTPFGIATVARKVAKATNVPVEEAMAYIRGFSSLTDTLSLERTEKMETVLKEYATAISDLFTRTGDTLSIPRTIFLHTDKNTEPFFAEHIKKAAASATNGEHTVHLITSKLLNTSETTETALMLSAQFFHNRRGCDSFEID